MYEAVQLRFLLPTTCISYLIIKASKTHTCRQSLYFNLKKQGVRGMSSVLLCYPKGAALQPDSAGPHLMYSGDKCRHPPVTSDKGFLPFTWATSTQRSLVSMKWTTRKSCRLW